MGFIAWIIIGFVGGAVAKAIVGKSMGWLRTLICGLIGGVVGGWLVSLLFGGDTMNSFFSPGTWIAAIAGSIIVVWLVSLFSGKHQNA
ncbi:MAG: GlsB/YeaQ/YmgE family stress response membrane protein [Arthrobacter sp.]|jgi:uncharacterized membrane protein YeaQ/YmgE (transglycosylase-associated protein family)|nr:GlsB/YeaQ/YmgE family stress response membrane protein [Arthrobacter sp.]